MRNLGSNPTIRRIANTIVRIIDMEVEARLEPVKAAFSLAARSDEKALQRAALLTGDWLLDGPSGKRKQRRAAKKTVRATAPHTNGVAKHAPAKPARKKRVVLPRERKLEIAAEAKKHGVWRTAQKHGVGHKSVVDWMQGRALGAPGHASA